MKIGIIFDDRSMDKIDMREPEKGNPGVGGAQYCVGMLIHFLKLEQYYEITVYQFGNTLFPDGIKTERVSSFEQCIKSGEKEKLDVLIGTHALFPDTKAGQIATSLKLIVWVHNPLFYEQAALLSEWDAVKRIVFVGRQLYDLYVDHPLCAKADYIFNMYQAPSAEHCRGTEIEAAVTFLGKVTFSKGLHVLAKQWPWILKKVPEAQLYVIGSGNLYDRQEKMGVYGIAEEKYEKMFMKYLTDKSGRILPSVHFCGLMGQEKYEILKKTAVGAMVSVESETFGLSMVEIEGCGVPVVARGYRGLLDTSVHGKTGYQYCTERALRREIVKLLKDRELNQKMGIQAKKFIEDKFNPEKIVNQWAKLIEDVISGKPAEYRRPENYYFRQMKFLKMLNRRICSVVPGWPSIMEWHHKIRGLKG